MGKVKATTGKLPAMICFLACDAVSTDPSTSKTSLYGLFDSIISDSLPSSFKPFALFVKLRGGSGTRNVSFECAGPGGDSLFSGEPEVQVTLSHSKVTDITVYLGTIHLKKAGAIRFSIHIDGEQIGWPCEVRVLLKKDEQ